MLKRAAQQQFVAWLALAAMMLLVLMPVLSRAMPNAPMTGMGADCSMDAGHAGGPHGTPGHPDDPTARCGYCVLLTHTPVVGMGAAVLLAPIDLPGLPPQTFQPRDAAFAPLLSARPRGPPLLANG